MQDNATTQLAPEIIDDISRNTPFASIGNGWVLVSDRVMGGVSNGAMAREHVFGRNAIRMTGGVSLENNGGFLQIALDLGETGGEIDASAWDGIRLDVLGNDQTYNLHLRTTDIRRPWESYRQSFNAPPTGQRCSCLLQSSNPTELNVRSGLLACDVWVLWPSDANLKQTSPSQIFVFTPHPMGPTCPQTDLRQSRQSLDRHLPAQLFDR